MPEACQLAKSLKRPAGGPSRETERSRHVPAERQDRRTPEVARPAWAAPYPVLPTARPIVALAITPAIRGFSCSRRSEYSYHCCPYGT